MFRFRNFLPLVALLVGATILGAPAPARANFAVTVFVDGVNQNVSLDAGSDDNSFGVHANVTDFKVSIDALSNWAGSQSGSLMSSNSNNKVTTNFGPSGGTHTIEIVISENGWLAPTGSPLLVSNSAGGSIGSSGNSISVAATNQGFLDTSNALATTSSPGGSSTALQSASASLTGTGTASLNYNPGTAVNPNVPGATPFTLTQKFKFTVTTNGNLASTAGTSATVSVTAAPAPAGLVLALSALPVLGVGHWLRRRRPCV